MRACMCAYVHVGGLIGKVYKCVVTGIVFPVRLSTEAKSIRQAGTTVGLLNVGSGLQGGSTKASLITAQKPFFIFSTVQLISVLMSEPLGKSDLLSALRTMHVLYVALGARQAFKTNSKTNLLFIFTASRE